MKTNKDSGNTLQKIVKGSQVTLDYETFVDGKLIDSSKMHKPIEIVFGFTSISKDLEKNISGKTKGHKFEINQTIDSKPVKMELPLDNLDDETIKIIQNNEEVELEINKFWYPFKVIKVNPIKNTAILEYKDPFIGKNVINKIQIRDVKKVVL